MYAPFGAGVLIGPRDAFTDGDPFLAGGGAVDLVDLDEVVWTEPPDREEAGSPNVIGAVALDAAIDELAAIGWDAIAAHDDEIAARPPRRPGARSPASGCSGPRPRRPDPAVATFTLDGDPARPASPPGSAPSSASASATAASAPTPTCCASSACHRRGRRLPGRRAGRRPARDPGRRAGQRQPRPPPPTTSTGSSPPSPTSPGPTGPGRLRPGPHTGDYWPMGDHPGWTTPTGASAPPARGAESQGGGGGLPSEDFAPLRRSREAPSASERRSPPQSRRAFRARTSLPCAAAGRPPSASPAPIVRPGLRPAQTSGRAMQTTVRSPSSQLSSVGRITRSCSPPQ